MLPNSLVPPLGCEIVAVDRASTLDHDPLFSKRFETTEAEWLDEDNPIDFTGIIISQHDGAIFLSMGPYIKKTLKHFNMEDCKPARAPISKNVDNLEPLNFDERNEFMSKLGACGWIANTVCMQTKHAVHRAAQHMASPCKGALDLVNQILRYHATNPDLGIGVPLVDPNPPQGADAIAIYCDSDNSCNPEVQNKRRGQFSNIIGYRSSQEAVDAIGGIVPTIAPVMMASKTLV